MLVAKAVIGDGLLLARTGFFWGRRKLTLAGGSIASRVSFLAPHRTNTGGQKRSLVNDRL
jgi:hypothetical protein